MPLLKLPEIIVEHLFNLHHGTQSKRYCAACDKVTDQVSISYSEIPALRNFGGKRFAGRIIDAVPGITLLGGKPTLCDCGHVTL